MKKQRQIIGDATILFAGDSGDGAQTVGAQLTHTSAIAGNDVSTLPDYPAEIRAPAGCRSSSVHLRGSRPYRATAHAIRRATDRPAAQGRCGRCRE